MDGTDTIHQAYALITRKHDGTHEIMLVEEADGEISFPGGTQEEGDVDVVSALRREFKEDLQLWPEQYKVKETSITLSFKYEREGSRNFGKTCVVEMFDVELAPGDEPRPAGRIRAVRWYDFDSAMAAVTHEGHRRLLMMGEDHLKRGQSTSISL